MIPTVVGMLLGAAAGGGLLTSLLSIPPMRRIKLADRVAPYIGDEATPSRLLRRQRGPVTTLTRLAAPLLRDVVRRMDRIIGGQASVRKRLTSLNSPLTIEDFRVGQVVWGAIGLLAGLGVGAVAAFTGRPSAVVLALLAVGGGVFGVLAKDYWLGREVRRRDAEILHEFPVVAEMMALAVTAGEGLAGAMDRMTRLAHGRLVDQLAWILADTRSGTPFLEALTKCRDSTQLEPFARFLDGMAVATERGTPLADVLRAQAADVRALAKRQLLESGGRKEVAMMIPVVFLVLPTTILFAMYPGLIAITTVAG